MAKAKCSRTDYTRANDDQLDVKAQAVQTGISTNTTLFPSPPHNGTALAGFISTYNSAHSAYKRGGIDQKPAFDTAKTNLLNAMDDTADYVDDIADGNEATIVAGGFVPTKTTSSPRPAPRKTEGVVAKKGDARGELMVECPPQEYAEVYGLLVVEGAPLPATFEVVNGQMQMTGITAPVLLDVNSSRKKVVNGLSARTDYYIYMWCSNAKGVGPLSDAVSITDL